MNTKQFRYVLTVAKEGSFSRAADVLNISQPSLSQYIKKIETSIGMELFERTNGDIRLTDAGAEYVETGRKILELEHNMEIHLSDISSQKRGSLIVGTSPYRSASMMPAVVSAFHKLYPGIHLIIREGTTAELAEGMEHGEYDLCLTLLPLDGRLFKWETVTQEELVVAVPSSFSPFETVTLPHRKYPAIDAFLLNHSKMVMLTEAQFMQKQLENLMIDCKLSIIPAAVVKSLEAQIEMVKAGIGMALVPSGIERFCHKDEVRFYSFKQELPKREVVLAWKNHRVLPRMTEEFIRTVKTIKW